VTRYICGDPIRVSSQIVGIDSSGFPKSLKFLKELVDSGKTEKLQFVMTLLVLSRAVSCDGHIDYKPITDPYKGEPGFKVPDSFLERFVADFDIKISLPD
jgi:hypothetical protein